MSRKDANTITAEQCRTARAWLGLSRKDLEEQSKVSERVIAHVESGTGGARLVRYILRTFFEARGIQFESGGGLTLDPARTRKPQ